MIFLVSVLIVFFIARFVIGYVFSNLIEPVDRHDSTPIEIVIPESSSASKIAQILYTARGNDEPGLIHNTAVFKVYVDFLGKANKMQAGTYILSRNMNMKQIIETICEGNPEKTVVTIMIPEGYSASEIGHVLLENNLVSEEKEFHDACNNLSDYAEYSFVRNIPADSNRQYALEGYLFPDTYDVYQDGNTKSIVKKFLDRFQNVFKSEYTQRAVEMGLTVDEVVILASLIEREAAVESDFAKVSAVFHNRLKMDMPLQSCASLSYILKQNKLYYSEEETHIDSPYNTYIKNGLPAGPICNPGNKAIYASLYPYQEYVEDNYLYFCNGNIGETKELIFSKTYEEHQQNVEQFKPYWN